MRTHTQAARASQSIDRIWVVQRTTGFDAQGAPVVASGHVVAGAFTSSRPITSTQTTTDRFTAANAVDLGAPQFDTGGVYTTRTERYIPKFFNFKETLANAATPAKYQFQVQGVLIPQAEVGTEEMYTISCNAMQGYHIEQDMSLKQYRDNYMVQCIRMNLPDSEYSREISGLDTRGQSSDIFYKSSGLATTTNVVVFVECTSTIRLGSSRALEVVV